MTPICDVVRHPAGKEFLDKVMSAVNAAIGRMGMADAHKTVPYAQQMPKNTGLRAEPLQTVKRMLPGLAEKDWEELFEKLNG